MVQANMLDVSCMLLVFLLSVSTPSLLCQSFAMRSALSTKSFNSIVTRIRIEEQGQYHAYDHAHVNVNVNVNAVPIRIWGPRSCTIRSSSSLSSLSSASDEELDMDPLENTKRQFEKLNNDNSVSNSGQDNEPDREALYQEFISYSANALKSQLKSYNVKTKGRKPDLARRLVDYVLQQRRLEQGGTEIETESESESKARPSPPYVQVEAEVKAEVKVEVEGEADGVEHNEDKKESSPSSTVSTPASSTTPPLKPVLKFASLTLSPAASNALTRAQFHTPTPVQTTALPLLTNSQRASLILHAETGSGKTLTYLLPITERMWNERNTATQKDGGRYALVLTPTRELASQVAAVATALAPPGSVRLITHPTNVVRDSAEAKERSEGEFGGRFDFEGQGGGIKLIVGSAKSVLLSTFGDESLAAPPTSKPEAKMFLKGVEYLVLDEVGELIADGGVPPDLVL